MEPKFRVKTLGAGILAGLVAAVIMTLVMLLLRFIFGAATPSEMFGDRLAPFLGVDKFLELLGRFGGYNHLKQIGVSSILGGQLAVGIIGGIIYALIVGSSARQVSANSSTTHRRGSIFVLCFVGALWLISVIFLWPTLGTHYHGLPPGSATIITISALLIAYAVYGLALIFLYRLIIGRRSIPTLGTDESAPDAGMAVGMEVGMNAGTGRRSVLAGGVGAVAALASGWLLNRFYRIASFSYDGTQYRPRVTEPITPTDSFYVVTKNVVDPVVSPSLWRLEITGLVNQPKSYTIEDLIKMSPTTQETTLRCISNQVGDGLISNAIWKGIPLKTLIEAAGPKPGATEVLLTAVDGYTDTIPFTKAINPTTLAAYEINGERLPKHHGYPLRLVVPGMYGEKNLKWLTRVEVVDYDVKGFYEKQGWGPNFVDPTLTRFDYPADKQKIQMAAAAAGLAIKGMAHAGDRGVSKVEVSFDNGQTWREAKIDYARSPLAWALWSYDWRVEQAGEYKLAVRSTDGAGQVQTAEERGTAPQGATGYHRITVQIEA